MRRLILAVALIAACDYTRPPPVGGDDAVDAPAVDADGDGAAVDAPPSDGIPAIDAPIDAPVDAIPIDAVPVDGPGTVSIVMTPPTTSNTLGTTTRFNVAITSNGYAGPVALGSSGGNTGWTRSIPASINLTVGQTQNVNFDVTVPTNGAAAPAGVNVTATATVGGMPVSDSSSLTIADQYILAIASGVGATAHWGGLTNLTLRNGTTFIIRNDDGTAHQIHASGGVVGLAHQASPMSQGQSFTSTLGSTGTDTLYCHVHSQSTGQFNLTVE